MSNVCVLSLFSKKSYEFQKSYVIITCYIFNKRENDLSISDEIFLKINRKENEKKKKVRQHHLTFCFMITFDIILFFDNVSKSEILISFILTFSDSTKYKIIKMYADREF